MNMSTNAFARARAMMAAISALMGQGLRGYELQAAIGTYKSRGKGGKTSLQPTGIAAQRRAALKRRNRARHRAACKRKG